MRAEANSITVYVRGLTAAADRPPPAHVSRRRSGNESARFSLLVAGQCIGHGGGDLGKNARKARQARQTSAEIPEPRANAQRDRAD